MRSVFIVEDEELITRLYSDVLTMRGYDIIGSASNGEEALEKYRKLPSRPDVILLDHRMPGMGGLAAARTILKEDPEARIIVVSADEGAIQEALKMGLFAMKKPFNLRDLLVTLEIAVL